MASSQFLLPVQSSASMATSRLPLSPSSPLHSFRRSRPNNLSTALRKTQLTDKVDSPLRICDSAISVSNSISDQSTDREGLSVTATVRRSARNKARANKARAEVQQSDGSLAADALTNVKHVLLPITDRNPYLSEGTRQAAATTTALAKKCGADITVVVIDDKSKESIPEHEAQLSSIRWHLLEGGFQEFKLMEKLGEGKQPTAIIGEVADDMNLDLVVLSMEAIHSKHVDGNLLAEFIPCPVLLLPL